MEGVLQDLGKKDDGGDGSGSSLGRKRYRQKDETENERLLGKKSPPKIFVFYLV